MEYEGITNCTVSVPSISISTKWGTFTAFIAQQSGWNTLVETEQVSQDTAIASNYTSIGTNSLAIAGLVAGSIITNIKSFK